MTILEAFRVLLQSQDLVKGKHDNTIEFHWYSAEEGGLLGSQAVFSAYEAAGRDVKAMLQQDMTGYVQRTLDAGEPESVGVIVDFVDPSLTEFIKKVIVEVSTRISEPPSATGPPADQAPRCSTVTSRGSRPSAAMPAPTTPRPPRRGILRPLSSRPSLSTRTLTSTRPRI